MATILPTASDNGTSANVFAPVNLLSFWNIAWSRPNLITEQYGNRGIWMHGATLAVVGNPISGSASNQNPTRHGAAKAAPKTDAITYSGVVANAGILNGASASTTRLRGTGSLMQTISAFTLDPNAPEDAEGYRVFDITNDAQKKRAFSGITRGGEDYNFISAELGALRTYATGNNGEPLGPIDAREAKTREDDVWDISPVFIENRVGSKNVVTIDSAADSASPPKSLATVDLAVGMRGGIISRNRTTSDLMKSDALFCALALGNTFTFIQDFRRLCKETGTDYIDETTSNDGIKDWAAMEVEHPFVPPEVEIKARTGVWADDMAPGLAGGEPLQVASLASSSEPTNPIKSVERSTSLIARGDSHFDNAKDLNIPSITYIKDVLQLEPRNGPPVFGETETEGSGVIYFDAGLNRLCVSMPLNSPDDSDSDAVIWLPLELEKFSSTRDGNGVSLGSIPTTDKEIASAADKPAYSYLRPRLDAVYDTVNLGNFRIRLANFSKATGTAAPITHKIYWRRPGYGYDLEARTQWAELSGDYKNGDYTISISTFMGIETDGDGIDPTDRPNTIVHLMAIDSQTGEAAGAAVDIGSPTPKDGGSPLSDPRYPFRVDDLIDVLADSNLTLESTDAFYTDANGDDKRDIGDVIKAAMMHQPPERIHGDSRAELSGAFSTTLYSRSLTLNAPLETEYQ